MEYWIWLMLIPNVGTVTRWKLIRHFKDAQNVYHASRAELQECGVSQRQLDMIDLSRTLDDAKRIYEQCQRLGISVLTIQDEEYPLNAQIGNDVPILLFYKGKLKKIGKTIGIVGARRCTQEDKKFTRIFSQGHVRNGEIIVSGMAKGVDSYAHTACIEAGGYTIAILANGLDICYPKEHQVLMERICEKGLLLSEYPPGTRPARYNFPRRNLIISAWSERLAVIAPGKNSGALITADIARRMGREVVIYDSGGADPHAQRT